MRYEDRISVATPEGLDLDLVLAGVGSRFIAALIDALIQGAVLIAVSLLLGAAASGAEAGFGEDFEGGLVAGVAAAVLLAVLFLVFFGYHVVFETWASGRTPGKRWTGLRVVRGGGAPVSFVTSAVRNVVRLVDFLPMLYGVGVIAIIASARNQRLGDVAAGTLVVREQLAAVAPSGASAEPEGLLGPAWDRAAPSGNWDVSAVSAEELATVRRFLERRPYLSSDARDRLGWELAARLRAKVTGPPEGLHPEAFLTELAAAKAARG